MTPEARARQRIDQKLEQAGWIVQDLKQYDPSAGRGLAVREYPTDTGPADYVLFVDRVVCGVIEAKKDSAGENITATEHQTERYATANLKWRKDSSPLRFLFEATGQIIRFTDNADPAPRSREIFHFFQPAQLAEWLAQPNTLRWRLREAMPPLPEENLRDCQVSAVTGLEQSLARNKPRALVHMATGAGKTFTAITAVYRLLKFGGARRILFLVDTRNLGKQAHQEFMAYTPPDDARKFTELYNVQRLASSTIDPGAQVCISTIQRMYAILSGEPIDESAEDASLNEVLQAASQVKTVAYNPAVPVESFDLIIIDECHRSIYNLWKQVQRFAEYLQQHKDEIAALGFFYQQPYQRRALTFEMIEELHEHLARPPLMLTTEKLWGAYARVQASRVKGTDRKRQLTDLVSLVRFALGFDEELKPFADEVDKRFQAWIFRHNAQRGTAFTPEQTEWLRLMKDHIASSCAISREDFDYAELAGKGGLQKAWNVFGAALDGLMEEMNEELVA
jgi:type I site-specific restriction endonuclease